MFQQLEGIGYLAGSKGASDKRNVTVYDKERSYPGINLYLSGHKAAAYLIDMEGNELFEWSFDKRILWLNDQNFCSTFWRRVYPYPNGDLIAIYDGIGIIKLDKDSNLLWAKQNGAHHDLEIVDDGHIYVLTREAKVKKEIDDRHPVLEDYISILSRNGETIKMISIYQAYKRSAYQNVLQKMPPYGDILHTNTLEIFDGRYADKSPFYKKGNALISCLTTSNIAIVDIEKEKVVWASFGDWDWQHQPTLVDNGNIMLFDNFDTEKSSKIIEFEPFSNTIKWIYRSNPNTDFFSATCGSCQRLPNGNTLITESDNGRAFEITRGGKIVWEFYNPHRVGDEDELVGTLFELIRFEPTYFSSEIVPEAGIR